jgi:hypothetical protein
MLFQYRFSIFYAPKGATDATPNAEAPTKAEQKGRAVEKLKTL